MRRRSHRPGVARRAPGDQGPHRRRRHRGLAAAVALGRAGVEPAVFERAPELQEIGAGISLWANATRALKRLSIYDEVRSSGAAEIGGELRSWRGEMISQIPAVDLRTRFGGTNLAI